MLYGVGSVIGAGAISERLVKTKATKEITLQILEKAKEIDPETFGATPPEDVPVFRAKIVESYEGKDGTLYALARVDLREYEEDIQANRLVPAAIVRFFQFYSSAAPAKEAQETAP
ncbi:MAG: hypothetical protein AAF658_16525 [Myxococcota bacterium]